MLLLLQLLLLLLLLPLHKKLLQKVQISIRYANGPLPQCTHRF